MIGIFKLSNKLLIRKINKVIRAKHTTIISSNNGYYKNCRNIISVFIHNLNTKGLVIYSNRMTI